MTSGESTAHFYKAIDMNKEEIYFGYYKSIMAGSYKIFGDKRIEYLDNLHIHTIPVKELESKDQYLKRLANEAHELALIMTENHLKEFRSEFLERPPIVDTGTNLRGD